MNAGRLGLRVSESQLLDRPLVETGSEPQDAKGASVDPRILRDHGICEIQLALLLREESSAIANRRIPRHEHFIQLQVCTVC